MIASRYWAWLATLPLAIAASFWAPLLSLVLAAFFVVGLRDVSQTRHAILRNYPLIGHLRFLLEFIRPEIRQYFLEDDEAQLPFSRNQRALVYQRAKRQNDKRAFGTLIDPYKPGAIWLNHSNVAVHPDESAFRLTIGNQGCLQPYHSSILNVSAMSFGALSANAIRALNRGAKRGNFAQDTGEGSISRYHREEGGDLIWEIGSGYFGCRDAAGNFSAEKFASQAIDPQVRMIEIKLSQGAKPGHGGVLPAAKVSAEIAMTRGVETGRDCVSPATHSRFSTPTGLLEFVAELRRLSGGKPVGFKLCIGDPVEFMGICKAMLETKIIPDFIVIDGTEGGTGAAPVEFADHVGMPARDGLSFAHNALRAVGLRSSVRLAVAGKIVSGFDVATMLALGADWCNAARSFMFALGCIQSRSCHTDECPTGIATQNALRQRGLDVADRASRVANFHQATVQSLGELIGSAGLDHPSQLTARDFMIRDDKGQPVPLSAVYPEIEIGALLDPTDVRYSAAPAVYRSAWEIASASRFKGSSERSRLI
jgi:glutamate synthase domain-containing protein 2